MAAGDLSSPVCSRKNILGQGRSRICVVVVVAAAAAVVRCQEVSLLSVAGRKAAKTSDYC